jgi:parallel beta-helix repeat protein
MKTRRFYKLFLVSVVLVIVTSAGTISLSEEVYPNLTKQPELRPEEGSLQINAVSPAGEQVRQSERATIDASKFPTLQAAFNALPDSGGVVVIPAGNYELTEPILLSKGDTHIKGEGDATHLINLNQNGEPALIIKSPKIPSLKSGGTNDDIWRVQLSDFRVSGNSKSGDGILLERVDEVFITGLHVDHNGRHGINLTYCLENPRINHCNVTYNRAGAGMYIFGCHDVVVSANQFEENQDALQFIDGFNLTMSGNNIDDHLRHGVVIENTYACVLSGNMIEECNGTAIILDRDCSGVTLSSNVIAHDLGGGIELRDAWGCTVSANTFVNVYNFSVLVGPKSGRDIITGNSFCNNYFGEGKFGWSVEPDKNINQMNLNGGTGIILQGTSYITISGNGFGGLSAEAVKANNSCSHILVTGNMMTDLGRRATGAKTAVDLGNAKECIVKDNTIESGLIVK